MATLANLQAQIDKLRSSAAAPATAAVDVTDADDALGTLIGALVAGTISQGEIDALVAADAALDVALTALDTEAVGIGTSRAGRFPWGESDNRTTP